MQFTYNLDKFSNIRVSIVNGLLLFLFVLFLMKRGNSLLGFSNKLNSSKFLSIDTDCQSYSYKKSIHWKYSYPISRTQAHNLNLSSLLYNESSDDGNMVHLITIVIISDLEGVEDQAIVNFSQPGQLLKAERELEEASSILYDDYFGSEPK